MQPIESVSNQYRLPKKKKTVHQSHHILLLSVGDGLVPQLLDGNKDPHTIANFLDPHLLENLLVTVDEVVAIEIVG